MRSYEFFDRLIVRIPRLPRERLSDDLQVFINDAVCRDAIYLASDSLYEELERHDFQLDRCDDRVRQALKKYQHRICYRPTPFAGFASIAAARWGTPGPEKSLYIQPGSFEVKVMTLRDEEASRIKKEQFRVNPALYAYGKNFRLYEGAERDEQAARIFKLTELDGEGLPEDLLTKEGFFSRAELLDCLSSYGLGTDEADTFVNELLANQVLQVVKDLPRRRISALVPGGARNEKGAGLYAHTSHRLSGAVDIRIQKKIREGIMALEHLNTGPSDNRLNEFKRRFTALFDRREVPLLLALDPEAGIDYGSGASWTSNNARKVNDRPAAAPWSKVQEVLLEKWTRPAGPGLPAIRLDEEDLRSLKAGAMVHSAPGMMALFSLIPGGIHLHAAGGVSGINMLGRFTPFDEELYQMALELSRLEQQANPDVILAEVLHESDELADRLNSRQEFRRAAIPVLTDCGTEAECSVELNDLWLSVSNGQLVLRSASLGKRVVPRLSTAYNHRRNSLSLYRFLCDLQGEGLHASLNFSLSSIFPGIPFYPAVYYKDVLLEPARWQVRGNIFRELSRQSGAARQKAFLRLATDLRLPELFVYEQHDQRLLIRRDSREDVNLLIEIVKNRKLVALREYHEDATGLVRDQNGRKFAHEIVTFMVNKENVYEGAHSGGAPEDISSSSFLEEWIHLKVYMHPSGMESFLLQEFSIFFESVSERIPALKWYFVRYFDTDDHLRIRIRCGNGEELQLLAELQRFLREVNDLPNIRTLKLATYEKELERYSTIGITVAEDLFCLSTALALRSVGRFAFLDSPLSSGADSESLHARLMAGVMHLYAAFSAAGFTPQEILDVCGRLGKNRFSELNVDKGTKVIYDQQYRPISPFLSSLFFWQQGNEAPEPYFDLLADGVAHLGYQDKYQVLVDLNHMHLNRLFPAEQNRQEARCYYYLHKLLTRLIKTGQV